MTTTPPGAGNADKSRHKDGGIVRARSSKRHTGAFPLTKH